MERSTRPKRKRSSKLVAQHEGRAPRRSPETHSPLALLAPRCSATWAADASGLAAGPLAVAHPARRRSSSGFIGWRAPRIWALPAAPPSRGARSLEGEWFAARALPDSSRRGCSWMPLHHVARPSEPRSRSPVLRNASASRVSRRLAALPAPRPAVNHQLPMCRRRGARLFFPAAANAHSTGCSGPNQPRSASWAQRRQR